MGTIYKPHKRPPSDTEKPPFAGGLFLFQGLRSFGEFHQEGQNILHCLRYPLQIIHARHLTR